LHHNEELEKFNFFKEKNVVILGGTGFIGQRLCEYLLNSGAHVTIVGKSNKKIDFHSKYLQIKNFDLMEIQHNKEIFENKNYVFQLSGVAGGIEYNKLHQGDLFTKNALLNLKLLDVITNSNVEKSNISDITAIICAYNSEKTIEKCLNSIKNNKINNIIIVDANSTDQTRNIVTKYNATILSDSGIGLGNARNVGLNQVQTKYVIYVGPDNVMPLQSIDKILCYMLENDWIGCSCMTLMSNESKTYLTQSMNSYKKAKFFPGEKNIIGTPWLYPTEILKKYKFNEKSTYSDDTELCDRLLSDGYKVGISDAFCYEIGTTTWKDIKHRWKMYGKSDSEFYKTIKDKLTLKNKIKSRLHAINTDLLLPLSSKHISFFLKIKLLPFLLLIVFFRLRGFN